MEEWRDIKGYEGLYQVSNLGRVKSLKDNHGNYREKILHGTPISKGYLIVSLYKNGKSKSSKIHRLVALHFIPNPNSYPTINHKDEDKTNNSVSNLEWCTVKYNNIYGTRTQRAAEKLRGRSLSKEHIEKRSKTIILNGKNKGSKNPAARKVQCITTGKKFTCIKEAIDFYSLNYCTKSSITMCCRGKLKSAGKHPDTGEKLKWKYID